MIYYKDKQQLYKQSYKFFIHLSFSFASLLKICDNPLLCEAELRSRVALTFRIAMVPRLFYRQTRCFSVSLQFLENG
jgi:hypothetical protein